MKKVVFLFLVIFSNSSYAQNFFWAKNIGDRPLAAATSTSGNIYTTGAFQGVVDFDPGATTHTLGVSSATYSNLYISITDASGNYITAYAIMGIVGQGFVSANTIKLDGSGNTYLSGSYATASGGIIDFDPGVGTYTVSSLISNQAVCFILKLDALGNLVWFRNLSGIGGISAGISMAVDPSGNVFAGGWYTGIADFDPGLGSYTLAATPTFSNTFVLKLDALGNFAFVKDFAGAGNCLINEMVLDISGNIFCTGQYQGITDFDPGAGTYTLSSAGGDDFFVVKLDAFGSLTWARTIGGSGNNKAKAIVVDNFGNAHITGASSGTADFDPGIGTYIVTSLSPADIFILKLDASGNFLWVKTFGNSSGALHLRSIGNSIDVDVWGNVYSTGAIGGNAPVDFDPGIGTHLLSVNSASFCSYISELDANGSFIWAGIMGGGEGRVVRVNNSGVYVAGYFYGLGIQDIDPTPTTYSLNGFTDGYILKLSAAPSIGGPSLFCTVNGSATSTYSVVNSPGNTYSWTVSPGVVLNSAANTWSVNLTFSSGPSTIAVAISNFSSSVTRTALVTVGTPPPVSITAVPSLSICNGSTVVLSGVGASTFAWSGGISNNVPFQPLITGNYVFTGLAANGCTASAIASVNVYPPPLIFYSVTPAYTVCSGYTVSFTQMGVGSSTYTYSGGILNNIPYVITTNTVVTITGTSPGGCTSSFSLPIGAIPGPSLVISASPSPTVCLGTTLALGATGASSTYSWSGGVTNNMPFVPLANSVFTVAATGTNNCISRATVSVIVNPLPTVNAVILPAGVICAGSSYTLNGTGAMSYTWTSGVGNPLPFTAVSNTAYVVSGTSAQGCINSATIPVVVNSLPYVGAVVLPSPTVCAGSAIILSGTGASSYNWSGGILNNIQFAVASSTSYVVTGVSTSGCANTATIPITVHPLPIIGALILPSPTVCTGSTLSLTGTGALTYSWSGGIVNNTAFTAVTSGVYTLTGMDANGCTNTMSVLTNVNPLPNIGFAVAPSTSVCAGVSINLSGTGALSYTWSNGVNNSVWFVPSATTVYSLSGASSNGCTSQLTIMVTVNPLPFLNIQPFSQTVAVGSATQFVVASSNPSTTYQWQQNQGSGFVNLTNAGHFSGVNTATLTATNANLSQNGDAFRCVLTDGSCSDTSDVVFLMVYDAIGIREFRTENDFNLLPNPAKDFFVISIKRLAIDLALRIIDQTGRLVLKSTIDNPNTVIDIHALSPGLYFVSLQNSNQKPIKLVVH